MSYTIYWADIPENARIKIINLVDLNSGKSINVFEEFIKLCNATYNRRDNTVTFDSEKHYTIFLLKFL